MSWGGYPDEREENGAAPRRASKKSRPMADIVASYDYLRADQSMAFQVVRDSKKDFYPRRPNTNRDPHEPAWLYGLGEEPRILYHLPQVADAIAMGRRIYVVEGEKDADSLSALGLVATTNPGGVGMGWTQLHADSMRGAASVVILPDNDAPGLRHAAKVRRMLRGTVRRVRIVRLKDVPERGDVSDWIAAGHTAAELESLCDAAMPDGWIAADALVAADMPPVRWLIPNAMSIPSTAVLSGWSGAFKSWIALATSIQLATGGRWLCKYDLDGARHRVMYLTADEDAMEVRRKLLMLKNGAGLDAIGDHLLIRASTLNLSDEQDSAQLLDAVADFQPDLIVVDHLRLVLPGDENSSEYAAVLKDKVAAIHAEHPCCVLFLHHWRKLAKEKQLNEPGQRARGTSALRGIYEHHLTVEREDVSPTVTFRVEKNRKGLEPPPFTINMRFAADGSMASAEYGSSAIDPAGEGGPQDAILELLGQHAPTPIAQSDIINSLHDSKGIPRTTTRDAVEQLLRSEAIVARSVSKNRRLIALRQYASDLFREPEIKAAKGGGVAGGGGKRPPLGLNDYDAND